MPNPRPEAGRPSNQRPEAVRNSNQRGCGGLWGSGADTQHEIFTKKIYALVPRAVGKVFKFKDANRPPPQGLPRLRGRPGSPNPGPILLLPPDFPISTRDPATLVIFQ